MLQKELRPDAQRYADDAKTLRVLAERMKFYDARQQLLGLAELYEKLAKLADEVTLHSLSAAALIATHDMKKSEDCNRGYRTSHRERAKRLRR